MTEAEWLACADPTAMLEFLRDKASERKLRLFACGCCRLVWGSLNDQWGRQTVEAAEHYADGAATAEELASAHEAALVSWNCPAEASACDASATTFTTQAAMSASHHAGWAGGKDVSRAANLARHADLLRCIVGTSFRPPPSLPRTVLNWNDGTVRRIAEHIYEERAFDRLLILADALLDAGCEDEDLIAHCRSEGPHVRGCWAIDAILGKS
jgi:hypothetical protein